MMPASSPVCSTISIQALIYLKPYAILHEKLTNILIDYFGALRFVISFKITDQEGRWYPMFVGYVCGLDLAIKRFADHIRFAVHM